MEGEETAGVAQPAASSSIFSMDPALTHPQWILRLSGRQGAKRRSILAKTQMPSLKVKAACLYMASNLELKAKTTKSSSVAAGDSQILSRSPRSSMLVQPSVTVSCLGMGRRAADGELEVGGEKVQFPGSPTACLEPRLLHLHIGMTQGSTRSESEKPLQQQEAGLSSANLDRSHSLSLHKVEASEMLHSHTFLSLFLMDGTGM